MLISFLISLNRSVLRNYPLPDISLIKYNTVEILTQSQHSQKQRTISQSIEGPSQQKTIIWQTVDKLLKLLLSGGYIHVIGSLARIYLDFVILGRWLLIRVYHLTRMLCLYRLWYAVDMRLFCCLDCLFKVSKFIVFFLFRRLFMLFGRLFMLIFIVVEILSRLTELVLNKVFISILLSFLCRLIVIWLRVVVILKLDYLFMRLMKIELLLRLNSFLVFELFWLFSGFSCSKIVELIFLSFLFFTKSM